MIWVQEQALDRPKGTEHHRQQQLCVPFVNLKGDSYRLKDRDLGRVVPSDDGA